MFSPMFGHRPKPKEFDYEFRYYDPKEDERRKRRLKFKETPKKKKGHQTRSVAFLAVGIALVLWIMVNLDQIVSFFF